MRRSPRFVIASLTAIIVGAGTAFTVATDLNALHRRAREFGPLRSVLVAVHDVPIGTIVTEGDVEVVHRHASAVPDDAIATVDAAVGHALRVPIVTGAVLQNAHLAPDDRAGLSAVVPAGRRALRIETVDGAHPEAGTIVDVLAALDPSIAVTTGRAVRVASGAQVLAVDDPATENTGSGTSGVTLLVTEEEAYDLAFAAANGVLTLAVAPPEAACCTSEP